MKLKELVQAHFHKLSKSQKLVAAYVLDHPRNVAVSSAQEIGLMIGVSETTVIRFCYSLGLSGYSELQKTIREQLLFQESSLHTYQQSKLELEQAPHFYEQVMEQDCRTISETIKQINETDYETAITHLSKAETVYILGLRSSYAAANWLTYTLGLVRHDVRLIRIEAEDVIRTISTMNDQSVLVAISFHRYLKETIRIAELASDQQAYVIAITDSLLAPIQAHSDVLFPIHSPNKSTLDATTALFSFMNAMVAGVSVKEKDNFEKRQETYQSLKSDFLFVEGTEKQ
ncbi:MurR/RpiR family transcriptional regulator [Sporosarcina sp. Marseille-Q4063]|uniref:MurR/RpiR family transcriptional regulator n=1 Tax=Sporosarcina sp. Marseille-Q4063 TaxID=2810514 RepID=UPI001BB068DB|nr:MurR/RpiR family transcriptional regulator [Sporosarcina sp. Marseille-Q4063]QUW23605.1 MurR/RpiR family transcriptional regulator [Sporosarcina sp. Marseille-Q4063]